MLRTDFKALIAKKLSDEEMVYWTSSNLDKIIDEALLTFNAIAGYWKDEILLESTNQDSLIDKQLYNLLVEDDVKTGFNHTEVSRTYADVIDWLDFDLVDYTDIATEDEVIGLITDAINKFQTNTKLVLEVERFNIVPGFTVNIGFEVLDIIAAYYVDSSGDYHLLQRADEQRLNLISSAFTTINNRPKFYSINNISLNIVDLFPRPNENGFLELIYVKGKTGAQTADSSCLIPNNLTPYLKYKVEWDLFSKDEDSDPNRAEYAKTRWEEGLLVGSNYSIVSSLKLDGINKVPASLIDFNNHRYGWRGDIESSRYKVNSIALAGYNILALNRMPINTHSLLIEAIINAPIGEDEFDIRDDYLPYLVDYCFHLAMIKDGIASIQKTAYALNNFIRISVEHNQYLQQRRISYRDLLAKSRYPIKQSMIEKQEENAA